MKNRCVLASAAVLAAAAGMAQGQQIIESFNDITTLAGNGWSLQNLCDVPIDAIGWFQGNPAVFTANSGGLGSEYIGSNFNRTSGTLNNCWLILPQRTLNNGDTLEFFARAIDGNYPDRLQVRMSTAGASTNAGPGLGSIDPGDFTNLLLDINPNLQTGVFVNAWTLYTVTVSGLAGPTNGRLAFRYFVENGGPTGLVSDYIGIDDVTYTPAGGVLTGACCLPVGTCLPNVTQAACTNQGGVYQGDNSPCGVCTPTVGRCCLVDGTCSLLSAGGCAAVGGTFGGVGVDCSAACPQPTCFEATGLAVAMTSPATAGTQGPVGTGNLVVGASQTITTMFAKVRAAHTWQGDARIELKHPDGTTIDLVTRPGASPPKLTNNLETGFSSDNYGVPGTTYMTFIDSASSVYDNAVGFPGPPAGTAVAINNPTGPYRAHGGSLNTAFGGKNVNGTWQVLGSDYWPGDEGTIEAFAVCFPAAATGPACFANCDSSTNIPCLNVQDFGCFLNAFSNGESYANCDGSTNIPVLNVQDFGCFLNAFSAGCSSCV